MVAISLYRGNLHRVPDVPRRWLMPTPKISLKNFRSLLARRSNALFRLRACTSNPNPNSTGNGTSIERILEPEKDPGIRDGEGTSKTGASPEVEDESALDGGDCSAKPADVSNLLPEEKKSEVAEKGAEAVNGDGNLEAVKQDKPAESAQPIPNPNPETTSKADELNDKEKRKKEVEEKLQVLNAKKHNLVQVLKQILNVEEELKRRSSMQGLAIRPSVPLQVDVTNDTCSMTRHNTPRMGSETNLGGDTEGGEAEDTSNHNVPSRYLQRMSSMSPSSDSPLRRPPSLQHNVVPHPSRSSLGATSSPSRFAPPGHPGHPANLPAVSVSGMNYVVSSPSPAASGGTSAFRDSRQPSPWN